MPIYPFDVKDVKVAAQTNTEAGATAPTWSAYVDLTAIQLVTIDEEEGDTQELRGDGVVVATSRSAGVGTFELRGGGIPSDVLALMYGGSRTVINPGASTGVRSSSEIVTLKPNYTQNLPFFKVVAQMLNADGGDTGLTIWKAQALRRAVPALTFEEGAFATTTVNGNYFWTNETVQRLWEIKQAVVAAVDAGTL